MWYLKYALLVLCLHIPFSFEETQQTYRAGVVEFGVSFTSDVSVYFKRNTQRYLDLIQEAASKNVDILVFPESTLNYAFTADRERILDYAFYIPDAEEIISPCETDDAHKILKAISCAARDGHLYVVINVSEKLPCDDDTQLDMQDSRACHPDGHYFFNTNVVFDRYGKIVSRYRKTHLFGEVAFNTTATPELGTFTTDFGVEFGHLICFDLQYETPAQALLQRDVKNFVLPLMWYSELPFLTAVQYEEAWAYTGDVNLLAAGASSPLSGSGGSGVFAGRRGARVSLLSGDTATRLLFADVYKHPEDATYEDLGQTLSENPRRMNMMRDHLTLYSVQFLDLKNFTQGGKERICYGSFCCNFNITVSFNDNAGEQPTGPVYEYALVAFRGVRTYSGVASGGVENCGLVACTGKDEATCGLRFSQSTNYSPYVIFEEITLEGFFTQDRAVQYPATLTGAMLPLTIDQFSFDSSTIDGRRHLTVKLEQQETDLLTFGVFGRIFSIDSDPVTQEVYATKVLEISRNDEDNFSEYGRNSGEEIFDYIWSKLRIPLVFVVIYVLEMM